MAQAGEQAGEYATSNFGGGNADALNVRLNTENLLTQAEEYLTGKRIVVYTDRDGKVRQKTQTLGEAKANPLGCDFFLGRLRLIINAHIAQGSVSEETHKDNIFYIRMSISENAMLNLKDWGIQENHYSEIIDVLMYLIKYFLTRPINNLERESFKNTIQYKNTPEQRGFNPFSPR